MPRQSVLAPSSSHTSAADNWEMISDKFTDLCSSYTRANEKERELLQAEPLNFSNIPTITELEWNELEKFSQEDQRKFLNKFQFKEFLVSSGKRNVQRGDHVFYPSSLFQRYNHHLLVTEVEGNVIKYIDYNARGSTLNPSGSVQVGKAQTTFEALQGKKAKIRVWPSELERYDIETVIQRAKRRKAKKERCYNLLTNNCEHFVISCKCGLNTSMQVKRREMVACTIANAAGVMGTLIALLAIVL